MPKTVLIILAAVIALIAIVVITGMRYLRADDEDDFDDDVPAENGRTRSRSSHLPHEQSRTRRHHHDDLPDERLTDRQLAGRNAAGRGSDGGADRRAGGRGDNDRGWREDSELNGRTGRASLPPREKRPDRSGRLPDDDMSEPTAASSRPGRSSAGRSGQHSAADYDSRTTRMPAAGRGDDGRGNRDRLGRAEDRDPRDRRDGRDVRDRRDVMAAASTRDTLGARDTAGARDDGHADRDERDRRSTTRPGARPDSRKGGAVPDDRGEVLPPVKPRQGRSKKDADGDWPSNEWDELSDVDYWAELASDRPLTTDKPVTSSKSAERARPGRGETRLDAAPGPARGERPAVASRETRNRQPARQARQPDPIRQPEPAILPPVTRKLDSTERSGEFSGTRNAEFSEPRSGEFSATGPRRASLSRAEQLQPVPPPPAPARDSSRAAPADDDPLTSPSFPRIQADDSRSYRRSRAAGADELSSASRTTDSGSHRVRDLAQSRELAQTRDLAQSREPAYPVVPRSEPVRGLDGVTQPHSYSRPADGNSGYGVASSDYERAAADYAGSGTEPYRVPSTSSAPGSYQVPAVASADRYPSSTDAYSGSASTTASYSVPATSGGYAVPSGSGYASPAAGYPAADSGGYTLPAGKGSGSYQGSGALPANYPPAAAGQGGYGGETVVRGAYPDPAGYQPSLPPVGGYQADHGVTSQPAAATGGYAFSADPASSYPGQADPPASYRGYPGPASSSGSHLRPEPGYLAGGYPAIPEPSFGGALPGSQPEMGYPVYAAPVPLGQTTAYQVPGSPLPGPVAGLGDDYAAGSAHALPGGYPEPQYRPDLYDPPGYQVPVPENGGYAGADPYAIDPYGYSGYGSGGH